MDERKLEKLTKLLEAANEDFAKTEDVQKVFEAVIAAFNDVKGEFASSFEGTKAEHEAQVARLFDAIDAFKGTLSEGLSTVRNELTSTMKDELDRVRSEIPTIPEIPAAPDLTPLQNQIAVLSEWAPEPNTAADIRNKLESLEDEDRLDASAIKNLPAMVASETKSFVPVNHPLWALMDVDIAGILAGQSIQWNGTSWKAYTPGSGSGLNYLAATGAVDDSNVVFTFASTPTLVAVNGALYNDGGGVTITGTTATLDNPAGLGGSVYGLG